MFVGYEIKAQQSQAKPLILETDIKLSQAVLDPSKVAKKGPVCLMVEYNKKQFIIAVLDSDRSWQCPLDLMFAAGSEIKFFLRGNGTVHLTGFEYRDDMNTELDFDSSSEEEDVDEDEDEDEDVETGEKKVESKVVDKRSAKVPVKNVKTNGVQKAVKKDDKDSKKLPRGEVCDSEDDDDDSDDEDFDSDMMDQDDDDIDMSEEDDNEGDLDDEDEESEVDDD